MKVIASEAKQSYFNIMAAKSGYVYIVTNQNNTVLYTGVTSDLARRINKHTQKLVDGFTKKYNATKLVFYESFDEIGDAIVREKQIKGGSRQKKVDMIVAQNPTWRDLANEL